MKEVDVEEEDVSSESDTTDGSMQKMDGTKPICFIGLRVQEDCSQMSNRGKRLPAEIFGNCDEDIFSHLSSLFQVSPLTSNDAGIYACPNANEQWLISNRLGFSIPDNALLCGKHRSQYGIAFKDTRCRYPSHGDSQKTAKKRGKGKVELRPMSILNVKAIKAMNSTVLKPCHLPVGSVWCTNCRTKLHPVTMELYTDNAAACLLCSEIHNSPTPETPPKRPRLAASPTDDSTQPEIDGTPCSQVSCSSQDSQTEYTPEEFQRGIFNKSMSSMDATWTPLRHVVRTELNQS